jgi:hypothetical protein
VEALLATGGGLSGKQRLEGEIMEPHEKVELAAAHANNHAVGQVAVPRIVSICNELARLGALDANAMERIRSFMLLSVERSGATAKLRAHIAETIHHHLGHLSAKIAQDPSATDASQ